MRASYQSNRQLHRDVCQIMLPEVRRLILTVPRCAEQVEGEHTANRPGNGADPVRMNQSRMDCGVEAGAERVVQGDLKKRRRDPDHRQYGHAGQGPSVAPLEQQQQGGGEFDEHRGADDEGDQRLVGELILAVTGCADPREEGIVNHLYQPDETGHKPGGGGVDQKQDAGIH